ncbi:DDB1- and CUL4-associated factor 1 [Merluccius polli]|uniref:DDB1- and CUL4-associated factor 1 n=1 Tax=Merluccius polli TaxID=89951 RepID=A0AA47MDH7_MERPO|nr:DDB1- and CUL4-associated factor 1 [Merluccius polli]
MFTFALFFCVTSPQLLAVFMQMGSRRELLMHYMDLKQTNDVQLTFEALKYLASLLLHKKFAAEFVAHEGVQKLLEIPRPSMAATGVSLCSLLLGPITRNAIERVCMLPALHPVRRCRLHFVRLRVFPCIGPAATPPCSFSISFSFRVVLELFDRQDGLRAPVHLKSSTPKTRGRYLSDDEIFSAGRTAPSHTCMAPAQVTSRPHLAIKVEHVKHVPAAAQEGGARLSGELHHDQVVEMMEFLIEYGPLRLYWEPAEVFHRLSCVQLLLQLISIACNWRTYYGRSDTVRYALDILSTADCRPQDPALTG